MLFQGHSDDLTTYVLSHFTGILITTLFYFFVYCIVKRGEPVVSKQVVLPGTFFVVATMLNVYTVAKHCFYFITK